MKFRFNTGRPYQPKEHEFAGQVIDVEVSECRGEYVIKFWDRSRSLDGAFFLPFFRYGETLTEGIVREEIMAHYDKNLHLDITYFDYMKKYNEK